MENASPTEGHVPTMNKEKIGTPFIYVCTTMWHETKEEMESLLQSIFRSTRLVHWPHRNPPFPPGDFFQTVIFVNFRV